jgi:hypothetical protein
MVLDEELNEKYSEISYKIEALKKIGKELSPLVTKHFNNYIETVINPALPEGYSLIGSDRDAFYSDGKFIVSTGLYQTPNGPTKGPLQIEDIVMEALDKYKKDTPWIGNIWENFSLSR